MARTRKTNTLKGKKAQIEHEVEPNSQGEHVGEPERQGNDDPTNQSLSEGQRKRKCEANISFWKDLGFYEARRRYKRPQSISGSAPSAKRHHDLGKAKEKYRLCTNQPSKRVLLLQYPSYPPRFLHHERKRMPPVEVRMKPKSGVIEVDFALANDISYDQEKGADFGNALHKSSQSERKGAYGLAGGLGIGPRRFFRGEEDIVMGDGSTDDPNDNLNTMSRFTLGGRIIPFKNGDPIHMTATYEGTTCTWTKVDAIVQLRPHFGHLDAKNDLIKAAARKERGEKPREELAEDVNMSIKDTADNDSVEMYGGMNETARLLRTMRDEQWQHLSWQNFNNAESLEILEENLSHQKESNTPFLLSEMTNTQYLDAISCPRIDPLTQGKQVAASLDNKNQPVNETTTPTPGDGEHDQHDGFDSDSGTESDFSSNGRAYETLPARVTQPLGTVEQDIERICRLLALSPPHSQSKVEARFGESLHGKEQGVSGERFGFLDPKNEFHGYFRWRLERNRKGKGVGPEFDCGVGVEMGEEVRKEVVG